MAGREDWQARCLREKRARKRRARGSFSDVKVLRRAMIVGSSVGGGDVADGAMLLFALDVDVRRSQKKFDRVLKSRGKTTDNIC